VTRRLGHRRALDGVRAVAIVGVMGLHGISHVFQGGFYGVDVFFVLSAFLITTLIIEEYDQHAGRYDFRSFYWRRAFRLGPALFVWLAVIAPLTAVAVHQGSHIPTATAASLFYFSDFAIAGGAHLGDAYLHVWSLSVEEQFYLVWPLLLVAVVLKRTPRTQRALLAASVVVAAVVMDVSSRLSSNTYFLPTGHLIAITAGCLTAIVFVHGGWSRVERFVAASWVGVVCVVALAVLFVIYREKLGIDELVLLLAAAALTSAVLILHLCLRDNGPAYALLSSPAAVWLGRRSYGLYLYHRTFTILIPALIPGIAHVRAWPLALAISLVTAELSFRLVERPINRAGRSWLRKTHEPGGEAEFALPITTASS
jgi:peptidoglycan/LPS O-acetylase OafA/YrhL